MKFKCDKGTPFDYRDDKMAVYLEIADKPNARKNLENIPSHMKI